MGNNRTTFLVLIVAAIAVALFIRGGEVLTTLAISSTNSTTTSITLTNSMTNSEGGVCYNGDGSAMPVNLVGGSSTRVVCNVTVNDPDGWQQIKLYHGNFYYPGGTSDTCMQLNSTHCYQNMSCQNITKNSTAAYVECGFNMWYNAQNSSSGGTTHWYGNVTVNDSNYELQTIIGNLYDVNSLLAIGVTPTLALGGVSQAGLNSTDCSNSVTVTNYGNVQLDWQVNASTMSCTVLGSIPPGWIHANTTNTAGNYRDAWPLSATLTGPVSSKWDFNLSQSGSATSPPAEITTTHYFGIGIPPATSGTCTGVIWFAAILS